MAFVSASGDEAREAREALVARYGQAPVDRADVVIALGGDGHMLETLRAAIGADNALVCLARTG